MAKSSGSAEGTAVETARAELPLRQSRLWSRVHPDQWNEEAIPGNTAGPGNEPQGELYSCGLTPEPAPVTAGQKEKYGCRHLCRNLQA